MLKTVTRPTSEQQIWFDLRAEEIHGNLDLFAFINM
jgi:hypothetical protein